MHVIHLFGSIIGWVKSVLRIRQRYLRVRMDTDISSTLGAMFMGNMDVVSSAAEGQHHGYVLGPDVTVQRVQCTTRRPSTRSPTSRCR